jgi:4-hydroxy-tetrahydrodipicolinate reductase
LAVDGETVAVTTDPAAAAANCDVLIDFTLAESCPGNVEAAAQAGTPCVVGTTGLGDDAVAVLRRCAETIPVVYAPNMSVGVNLLFKLTQQVAAALGLDYNIEISEIHHNKKKDSPSGTAVRLAECAAEGLGLDAKGDVIYGRQGAVGERPVREIGVHALRGGDIAGEHTVVFAGQGERLELAHKAHSRDNFAQGALTAARFAVNAAPGLYDMQDVLGLR